MTFLPLTSECSDHIGYYHAQSLIWVYTLHIRLEDDLLSVADMQIYKPYKTKKKQNEEPKILPHASLSIKYINTKKLQLPLLMPSGWDHIP